MVLIEVAFPSGYESLPDYELSSLQSSNYEEPDRIEKDRGNVVLYYNEVGIFGENLSYYLTLH